MKYEVSGDPEKILHQVKVKEGHRNSLRFLLRDSPSDEISDYQMLIHLSEKPTHPPILTML